jgi:hypothetical protein
MQALSAAVIAVFFPILALSPLAAEQAKSDGDDDTLKHYLSKAEVVVVGEVTDGLQKIGVDFGSAYPVERTEFEFQVSERIKGQATPKQMLRVTVARAQDLGHWMPGPGEKLVLFLKSSGSSWVSADKWFGAQPYSRAFVIHLKRVKIQPEAPAKDR